MFAAGHADIECGSWYLHGLGIPRIEDRRYDVVISFHIQHPFLCFYAIWVCIFAPQTVELPDGAGSAQVPTSHHVCIETRLIDDDLQLFRDDVRSRLCNSAGRTAFGWCYVRR